MQSELIHKLALSLIPGIGAYSFKQLISYSGSAEEVFKTPTARLRRIPGIGIRTSLLLKNTSVFHEAEKIIRDCEKQKIKILFHSDDEFPKRVRNINDAPSVLYFKGNGNLNPKKSISIVGTRKASHYGLEVSREIVADLIEHQCTIVSGLAYGIDISAHNAALKNELPTIAVLAGGLDKIYPSSHRHYAEQMLEKGGILTEHPPGTIPDAPKFPARNRIIASLCDAVIVVEAAEKGGALITAELANGYNKDVFAVPGNIYSKFSEGCNSLIKNHKANIYTRIGDLEYYLNWDINEEPKAKTEINLDDFEVDERSVITELKQNNSLIIDEISWNTQIPIHKLASLLLNLEFKGIVNSLPGKKFSLTDSYK